MRILLIPSFHSSSRQETEERDKCDFSVVDNFPSCSPAEEAPSRRDLMDGRATEEEEEAQNFIINHSVASLKVNELI
jgi:hypothetical protein